MEAGPLDLVLKSSVPDASSKDAGRSLVLELSGGHVIFRTCADSCVALRDLVLYLASDGDLIMSQTKLDNEETVPSPAVSVCVCVRVSVSLFFHLSPLLKLSRVHT